MCQITMDNGMKFQGLESDGVVTFKSIPYAEAPVGDLRWKSPVLRTNYQGTIDATAGGAKCMTLS